MTDLIIANIVGCALVGLVCVVIAWMALWRRYKFLMSPLGFQITLLAAYMAAIGIPLVEGMTSVWVATIGPQLVFLVTLLSVLAYGMPANRIALNVLEKRGRIARDPLMSWFFILLAIFVVFYYFVSLLGSGFSLSRDGLEGRSVVASQNKFLFYIFTITPAFLSIGIHLFRGLMRWLTMALAILTSAISMLAGSKGGLLTLCVIAVSCFYLRWLDGELSDRQARKVQFRMLLVVASAMIVTPLILFTSNAGAGVFAILARVLSGFDMMIYLGITYDNIDQVRDIYSGHHLSVLSFILATPMKIVGLYDQQYDSMSKFLWDKVLELPAVENLPNDNLFVTLSIGISPLFSAVAAFALALLFGALYNTLLRRRYDSCFHLLLFWWLSGNVVSCILSPQLSISSIIAVVFVYLSASILSVSSNGIRAPTLADRIGS
jgi:hypothetical protein